MTTAADILAAWQAVEKAFRPKGIGAPRLAEWFLLLRVVAAGREGITLADLGYNKDRRRNHAGRLRKRINRWKTAGLVVEFHDLTLRHPLTHKPCLRLRATPKALQFLHLRS